MSEPAYTRLTLDERRAQILAAGTALFAEHSYEEISMREIAQAACVSKPLLYHYFPSKIDLFKAAVAEAATELQRLISPSGSGSAPEQLAAALDAYVGWIDEHAHSWTKLMQSAAALPEARSFVEGFRAQTMELVLAELTGGVSSPAALRSAIAGWFGYMDAAILDWLAHRDLARESLCALLIGAFGAALMAAQQIDPEIELQLG